MKQHAALVLAVACALSGTHVATANVWERALSDESAQLDYENQLARGDALAKQADTESIAPQEMRRLADRAVEAYQAAAKAKPAAGEPYFRIGMMLYAFYFQECGLPPQYIQRLHISPLCSLQFNAKIAERIIAAWDAFEARAPLDPRATPPIRGGGMNMLFERAILHTKFATRPHLEAAAHDYEEILRRTAGGADDLDTTWNNLAETYMMLGDLDHAIEGYRNALKMGADAGTALGYAVALDRDGNYTTAAQVINELGAAQWREYQHRVSDHSIFYVPAGEEHYYFALAHEAHGELDEAVAEWKAFIASGAHPNYQARAKQHLEILAKTPRRPRSPIPLEDLLLP